MGYTTEFDGVFRLNKKLDEETETYLHNFAKTRRMKRDPKVLETLGFGPAESFGIDGEFFVNEDDLNHYGQTRDDSIIDYNDPPRTQPGLWCQWVPTEDGTGIEWDGGEKFYHAAEWIDYIVKSILAPKGYVLNGIIDARGEDFDDIWYIQIVDNIVTVADGFYSGASNDFSDKWIQLKDYLEGLKAKYNKFGDGDIANIIEKIENKMDELE